MILLVLPVGFFRYQSKSSAHKSKIRNRNPPNWKASAQQRKYSTILNVSADSIICPMKNRVGIWEKGDWLFEGNMWINFWKRHPKYLSIAITFFLYTLTILWDLVSFITFRSQDFLSRVKSSLCTTVPTPSTISFPFSFSSSPLLSRSLFSCFLFFHRCVYSSYRL